MLDSEECVLCLLLFSYFHLCPLSVSLTCVPLPGSLACVPCLCSLPSYILVRPSANLVSPAFFYIHLSQTLTVSLLAGLLLRSKQTLQFDCSIFLLICVLIFRLAKVKHRICSNTWMMRHQSWLFGLVMVTVGPTVGGWVSYESSTFPSSYLGY